jgi:hypothetical protein
MYSAEAVLRGLKNLDLMRTRTKTVVGILQSAYLKLGLSDALSVPEPQGERDTWWKFTATRYLDMKCLSRLLSTDPTAIKTIYNTSGGTQQHGQWVNDAGCGNTTVTTVSEMRSVRIVYQSLDSLLMDACTQWPQIHEYLKSVREASELTLS